jgi:hypothetical protein
LPRKAYSAAGIDFAPLCHWSGAHSMCTFETARFKTGVSC